MRLRFRRVRDLPGASPRYRVAIREELGRPYSYQQVEPGRSRERGVEHDTSTLGMGLVIGGDAWCFPLLVTALAYAPRWLAIFPESSVFER